MLSEANNKIKGVHAVVVNKFRQVKMILLCSKSKTIADECTYIYVCYKGVTR